MSGIERGTLGLRRSGKNAWIPRKSAPCASPPMSAAQASNRNSSILA